MINASPILPGEYSIHLLHTVLNTVCLFFLHIWVTYCDTFPHSSITCHISLKQNIIQTLIPFFEILKRSKSEFSAYENGNKLPVNKQRQPSPISSVSYQMKHCYSIFSQLHFLSILINN